MKKFTTDDGRQVMAGSGELKICVYVHISKKSRVGRHNFFFTIGKTGNSRSRFRYFIFEISHKPSFVEAVFYDELRSFSTFFALNFDKKLAVE